MREIKLTQGQVAIVDKEDYEELMKHKWCASKYPRGYVAVRAESINGKYKMIRMHRQIMQVENSKVLIDHINHNSLDNRKSNLRECTKRENAMNMRSQLGSNSKYIGVDFIKKLGKWRARINVYDKEIHGGVFMTEEEAAKARDVLSKKYFGEFANLNFKD